ncbi:glucose dehydrogenase [FAD, quinone]-like [Schistocerca cancellata]|uniref:glucose dehydrogenase [FAD, quinone]-like n=1 Tax=Schistocerca cancellata TaxID=274614 RepID=UPI00211754D3|nr:glucose dehydrogenase [FAD, quinone]-like [Schistocerca cancellata]
MHHTCPVDASGLQSCPVGSGAFGMLFTGMVTSVLQSAWNITNEPLTYPREPKLPITTDYDFIIIGAGSAGSVMASRLSEVAGWNVLLLEAGGDPSITTEVPALQNRVERTYEDWQFVTEEQQQACLGFEDPGRCLWPRGKMVGGSSNLYGLVYVRGNKCDYDGWARQGLTDWSYDKVLPYFKKSEDLRSDLIASEPDVHKYHGFGGYYTVSQIKANLSVYETMKEAVRETGHEFVVDLVADKFLVFSESLGDIRDGERCSNAKAFLSPAGRRSNLHLLRHAFVTKILIDPETKRAYGVEFMHGGEKMTANVTKEVILSAGTVQSPQFLMLSGVGPEDELKSLNITTIVANDNVGANLQDHLKSPIITFCINNEKYRRDQSELTSDDETYQYLKGRTGPLATLSCNNFLGFIRTNSTPDEYCPEGYPDIEMQLSCVNKTDDGGRQAFLDKAGFGEDARRGYNEIFDSCDMTMVPYMTLLHPRSVGKISLNSSDPRDPPKIDPQYLTRDEDIQAFLGGDEYAIKFGNTEAMKNIGTEVKILTLEACSEYEKTSKEYWECGVRHVGYTIYHPVGTCKMGVSNDSTAVVDPTLKVLGVEGLRVVDASVIPSTISGNIHAAVTMVAEKAADYVKSDWSGQQGSSTASPPRSRQGRTQQNRQRKRQGNHQRKRQGKHRGNRI